MNVESREVRFSNIDISKVIAKIEVAVEHEDKDLVLVSLLAMALCISDEDLWLDSVRFSNAMESVSQHICWVLRTNQQPSIDVKKMN